MHFYLKVLACLVGKCGRNQAPPIIQHPLSSSGEDGGRGPTIIEYHSSMRSSLHLPHASKEIEGASRDERRRRRPRFYGPKIAV